MTDVDSMIHIESRSGSHHANRSWFVLHGIRKRVYFLEATSTETGNNLI